MKENILFGCDFDPERYEAVIQACALEPVSRGETCGLGVCTLVHARAPIPQLDWWQKG